MPKKEKVAHHRTRPASEFTLFQQIFKRIEQELPVFHADFVWDVTIDFNVIRAEMNLSDKQTAFFIGLCPGLLTPRLDDRNIRMPGKFRFTDGHNTVREVRETIRLHVEQAGDKAVNLSLPTDRSRIPHGRTPRDRVRVYTPEGVYVLREHRRG